MVLLLSVMLGLFFAFLGKYPLLALHRRRRERYLRESVRRAFEQIDRSGAMPIDFICARYRELLCQEARLDDSSDAKVRMAEEHEYLARQFDEALEVRRVAFSKIRDIKEIRERLTPRKVRRTTGQRPPLGLLSVVVKALWSAKKYDQVFKPVIADIHHEWRDARRRHEKVRAWWIKNVRGRYAVLDVARSQLPWSVWSLLMKATRLIRTLSK